MGVGALREGSEAVWGGVGIRVGVVGSGGWMSLVEGVSEVVARVVLMVNGWRVVGREKS